LSIVDFPAADDDAEIARTIVDLDRRDPLRALRDEFEIPAGIIYLDGNSLGALARQVADRVRTVLTREWGRDLVGAWVSAGWIDLPRRVGSKLAPLLGAAPDEVVVADSTSVNLFKCILAAADINRVWSKNSSERLRPFTPPLDGDNTRAHRVARGIAQDPRDERSYSEETTGHHRSPDDSAQHGNTRHIRSLPTAASAHQRGSPWTNTLPSLT
jgi:hypothetical protein